MGQHTMNTTGQREAQWKWKWKVAEDERGSMLATNCNREMNWRVVEDEGREKGLAFNHDCDSFEYNQ